MFFRNLTLFRFPTTLDFSQLDSLLAETPLKPVGALELSSRGFISPFGRDSEELSHRIGDSIWLTMGGEDLIVRKLKFLDGAVDQLENTEREDLRAELDARFALMSGEVKRLFVVLESALKLSKAES